MRGFGQDQPDTGQAVRQVSFVLVPISKLILSDAADTSCLAEPAAESSLRSSDLSALTEVLLSLSNDETGKAALGKAARAVERVRRTCSKILDRLSKSEAQAGLATLDVTIRQWLVAGVELVEDLLQTSAMVGSV